MMSVIRWSEATSRIASLERIPARVRRETSAVFCRELAQIGGEILRATGARILQRTAAERSVAGSEDHGPVDKVGIVDDAFAQACDADVRDRQHQAVDQFRLNLRIPGI